MMHGSERIAEICHEDWNEKGRPAPEYITAAIEAVKYSIVPETAYVVCCIILKKNKVHAKRAVFAHAGMFEPTEAIEHIQRQAYEKAFAKLYAMGGFIDNEMADL